MRSSTIKSYSTIATLRRILFCLSYRRFVLAFVILSLSFLSGQSQQTGSPKPVLYVVSTSHLDSQWNWTVQDTIREFVPNTFFENFKRLEQYPDYNFTYEGAIHYMWFRIGSISWRLVNWKHQLSFAANSCFQSQPCSSH